MNDLVCRAANLAPNECPGYGTKVTLAAAFVTLAILVIIALTTRD